MKKIYIGQLIAGKSHLPILYPNLGPIDKPQRLFFNFAKAFPQKFFELTKNPEEADFLLIPHDFFLVAENQEYLDSFVSLAESHKKNILIFDHSDFDKDIDVLHSIIFRVSRYRHQIRPNEIIMPPITEDLGAGGLSVREKGIKPVVSFCGFAGFRNTKEYMKYLYKCIIFSVISIWDHHAFAHMPGLYFRRLCMKQLRKSDKVTDNFIVRSSYSGHRDSIELDPAKARQEYIKNIIDADFVLCPKGDGNYSNRLYEVLSLGRIPILIDTECVLPLESELQYSQFIFIVPSTKISGLADNIRAYFDTLDSDKMKLIQQTCRNVFEKSLRTSMFFRHVFIESDFLDKYKNLQN